MLASQSRNQESGAIESTYTRDLANILPKKPTTNLPIFPANRGVAFLCHTLSFSTPGFVTMNLMVERLCSCSGDSVGVTCQG